MKKVVIIGASSGIGKELAKNFSANGYIVGLASRRLELLNELKNSLPNKAYVKELDLYEPDTAITRLNELLDEMGDVDIIVINSGTGHDNPVLEWCKERPSVDVNVRGFTAMAVTTTNYFIKRGKGHIVGISSVAGIRPFRLCPAYGASKAYMIFYLNGLRNKFTKEGFKDIHITDIRPGFVYTDLTKDNGKMFWVSSVEKAGKQIYEAIIKKKKIAYVTKRWRLVAFLMRLIPDCVYNRI
jgi:short-subunit dehydrogenase